MSLLTNLIEHWNLDEASGTRAGSYAGLTLTDNNTVTQAAGKVYATAAQFTAANSEKLSRASSAALQTGDIDCEFALWFYLDSNNIDGLDLLGKWTGSTSEYVLETYKSGATSHLRFKYGTGDLDQAVTLPLSTWHFVRCGHDSVNDLVYFQLNGGTVQTLSYGSGNTAGTSSFTIGDGFGASRFFNGRIGPVSFWKRCLTTNEGASLYNGGSGLPFSSFPPPTLTAASVNTAGTTLSLTFSESVTGVAAADYALTGAATLSSATGSGTSWSMTISPPVLASQTRTLSYAGSGTADGSSDPLATFSGTAVTNNSTAAAVAGSLPLALSMGLRL